MSQLNDYAILVGVRHYVNNEDLEGPHGDVDDFRTWLEKADGGNLPHDNIFTFPSTLELKPTQIDIDRCFGSIIHKLQQTRGRRLYFYFSGHGISSDASNSALLLPEWSSIMRDLALSSEKYIKSLESNGVFEDIYFFMDCCRNRIPGVTGSSPVWGVVRPTGSPSEYLQFYSCEYDTPSYEASDPTISYSLDNSLTRGLFTKVLLAGLNGAAADKSGNVTVQNLVNYITYKLPIVAKAHGKNQIPKPNIKIGNRKIISGPFPKRLAIEIHFDPTLNVEMVLENEDVEVVLQGKSSDLIWKTDLFRGEYFLRKRDENNGMSFYHDGTQLIFKYDGQ
jgi:hypothetical protein